MGLITLIRKFLGYSNQPSDTCYKQRMEPTAANEHCIVLTEEQAKKYDLASEVTTAPVTSQSEVKTEANTVSIEAPAVKKPHRGRPKNKTVKNKE